MDFCATERAKKKSKGKTEEKLEIKRLHQNVVAEW